MFKISLSDGLAIAGAILAVVLIVLDKAEKLKGPMLLVLLATAALMTVPLALGNAWVSEATTGALRFTRGMFMIFLVGLVYSAISIWISTDSPAPSKAEAGNRAHLSAVIETKIFGEIPGDTDHCSLLLVVTVRNTGAPSIAEGWNLRVIGKTGEYRVTKQTLPPEIHCKWKMAKWSPILARTPFTNRA